jgi:hypothetical protein
VIVIIIVLGGITFVLTRNSYMKPVDVIIYPNAILSGTKTESGADHSIYYSPDTWDRVASFYKQVIGQTDSQDCHEAGDKYVYHCLIDHVTFGYEQTTLVTVIPATDPQKKGQTEIDVDRTWPTS